ncbi:MAG: phosphatase PAP2 family protein [Kiloniellales bacterium]|nr:phosphatase PAP2 family protein [Kiloniellales bacterium]
MQTLTVSAVPGILGAYLRRALRVHVWFITAVFVYALFGQVVPRLFGLGDYARLSLYNDALPLLLACFLLAFAIGHALHVMLVKRPARLIAHLLKDYRERFLDPERLANAAVLLLILPIFFSVFTSFKVMIPLIEPFSWDPAFARWDEALHGGQAPWELLHPVLGFPPVTTAINFVYHLWFFVLYAVMFWQGFTLADPHLRMQYLLSTVLIWSLLGSLAATLLSSAGPCYYGAVTGKADPFSPLMAYLRAAAESHYVPAVAVQDMLWADYQAGRLIGAGGISAMPSLHVASSFLFVLLGWRTNRILGWATTVFFLFILIGSVHLGWHYAIDGYLAVALAWPLWLLAGRLLDLDPLFRRSGARPRPAAA